MKINFASLAFGYTIRTGGSTPNWATALGQGKDYKINKGGEIDEIIRGMIYSAVHPSKISTKIGKGGNVVRGDDKDAPIVIGSVFSNVFINDIHINDGKFILLITKDTSKSHSGRLRLKYGPSNTYQETNGVTSNAVFFEKMKKQLNMHEDACWFVSDISIEDQNKLVLKTTIVNEHGPVEYEDKDDLHSAWALLDPNITGNELDGSTQVTGGQNLLFFGVPGSGKSHTIDKMIKGKPYERVVFHPDYTYSDFVGQIMPRLKGDDNKEKLTYEFVPGPFTKIMKEACNSAKKDQMFYLVIEEINRGNAPAIFGDVFQLLDRKETGEGKYHITNYDIAREVYGNEDAEVRIPSNLSILATMNTSDQNVFTLDTAFQRRWNMKYIDNDVNAAKHADVNIEGSSVTWGQFANVINDEILEANAEMLSSEDKQLGAYFVEKDELSADKFPEKALKYLWDDAFKMERDKIFDPNIKSIGNLVTAYTEEVDSGRDPIARVMKEDVYKKMMDLSAKTAKEAFEDDDVFEARKDD